MAVRKLAAVVAALVLPVVTLGVVAGVSISGTTKAPAASKNEGAPEKICISNFAQRFWSDAEIKNAIPAWEHALNVDFSRYWHTAKYKLVFIGKRRAPQGCISATIQNQGPIKGALAYHWTEKNNLPSITVYAGTGAYYGYDNSVSMTHELEEMAADPVTANLNVGYPLSFYYLQSVNDDVKLFPVQAVGWFGEVSDPVEADSYCRPGANGKCVRISDFVTPAWFGDGVGGRFDYLGLCQQPLWIRPGGYAQYFDPYLGWQIVENFRAAHPSDRGFSKQDPKGESH